MHNKLYILFVFCFGLASQSLAQIIPPDILCTRTDSIFWETPTNTCGMTDAYLLYGSNTEAGPYTLLETITDTNQDVYFHASAGNQTWFYYMQTDAACPNETVINSDTIDNQNPELLPIDFVTVLDNQVTINWTASVDSEVTGYAIYRVTPVGTVSIDTVFNSTQYIDNLALPTTQSEVYYVVAIDACDNTSIFDNPHFTTHLVLGTNACEQTVILEWNPYQNWHNGIQEQEIWASINGGSMELIATVADTTDTYFYQNANDGDTYCFYIEAVENQTGFRSRSNETCSTVDVIQPVNDLIITNVTVTDNNQVQVDWYWNPSAELVNYEITQTLKGSNTVNVFDFSAPTPLETTNTYVDTVQVNDNSFSYSIIAIDECLDEVESNAASTICLQGDALPNKTNQLSWTALDIPNTSVLEYEIFLKKEGFTEFLQTVDGTTTSTIDQIDPNLLSESNKCYCVEAIARVDLPDGSNQTIRSRSNTTCIGQFATIFTPNAFTPNGKNPEFKPRIVFGGAVLEYQLLIFDRWGTQLFESIDIDQGWDGRNADGSDMPKGAYTYVIRLQQPNGDFMEDKGVLVLLR